MTRAPHLGSLVNAEQFPLLYLHDGYMEHVFISYLRENADVVDRLADDLRGAGIEVWLDRERIRPGQDWRKAISDAIRGGVFFIACFSREYAERHRTYMNEELTLAIEELRLRHADRGWFLPVLLAGGQIPERLIGAGQALSDLQYVNLDHDWSDGVLRLKSVIFGSGETPITSGLTKEEFELNSQFRVEVVDVAPSVDDDDFGKPEQLIVATRLRSFGFKVSLGDWDSSRFLARYAPERVNSLYVVHRRNTALAGRLESALAGIDVAPRVVVLTTVEVSAASDNLPEAQIIEYFDALVAFRTTT